MARLVLIVCGALELYYQSSANAFFCVYIVLWMGVHIPWFRIYSCVKPVHRFSAWHPQSPCVHGVLSNSSSNHNFLQEYSNRIIKISSITYQSVMTVASESKIVLTPSTKGIYSVANLTGPSAECASKVLQENHEVHDIIFNDSGFHSRYLSILHSSR